MKYYYRTCSTQENQKDFTPKIFIKIKFLENVESLSGPDGRTPIAVRRHRRQTPLHQPTVRVSMNPTATVPDSPAPAAGSDGFQPDTRGSNAFLDDHPLADLLALYLQPGDLATLTPAFERLGTLVGGQLDELALTL